MPVPLIGAVPTPDKSPELLLRLRKSDLCGDTVRLAQLSNNTSNELESKSMICRS